MASPQPKPQSKKQRMDAVFLAYAAKLEAFRAKRRALVAEVMQKMTDKAIEKARKQIEAL